MRNKIDLVDYSQDVFNKIVSDFHEFSARLNFVSQVAIPLSARFGINVMEKSKETPWYSGPSLLAHLEIVDVDTALADKPFRLPVQWVNRPDLNFRGFSGTIAGGRIKPGDAIAVAKSGRTSTVTRIVTMDGDKSEAVAGDAITLTLADEVDISRGDVLADPQARPTVSDQFAAHLLWMADEELLPGRQYLLKLGTATVPAQVSGLKHKIDVNTLDSHAAATLALNEVGYVNFALTQALAFDAYRDNRGYWRFHSYRPRDQCHGRRRDDRFLADARHQCALAGPGREQRGAGAAERPEAGGAVVHRPVRLGQIHHRQSGGKGPGC